VRKLIAAGYLPAEKVDKVLEQIWEQDIDLIPDKLDLQRRAQAWARRLGQSKAYDGAYLAAAEVLRAEFWTADRELVKKAGVDWVRLLEAGPQV
jgi:predicted nucleic acid-binding protein